MPETHQTEAHTLDVSELDELLPEDLTLSDIRKVLQP